MRTQALDLGMNTRDRYPQDLCKKPSPPGSAVAGSSSGIWDTWMCLSSSTWATDAILALVCGLGLFILVVPYFRTKSSSPNMEREKNIRKHPVKDRWQTDTFQRHALKACRDILSGLQDIWSIALWVQSHLQEVHRKDRLQQHLCQDASREASQSEPTSAQQPHRRWVKDPSRALSLRASWDPGPRPPPPLTSTLSVEHPEGQADGNGTPSGTASQRSLPPDAYLASALTPTAGSISSHSSTPSLSSGCTSGRSFYFHTAACSKSQQELPPKHQPQALLWRKPTHRQEELEDLSVISSEVQKLLEMLITKRVELKRLREKGKSGSVLLPVSTLHVQDSQGNTLTSPRDQQDTTAQPIGNANVKAEWLQGCQPHSYPKVLRDTLHKESNQLCWGRPSPHSESLAANAWVAKRSSHPRPTSVQFSGARTNFSAQDQAEGHPPLAETQALPPPLPQVHTHVHTLFSAPNPAPSSPSHILSCRTTCPMSQQKAQSFTPTEHDNLDWPWQERPTWRKALAPKLQRAQEAVSQPPPSLTQGGQGPPTPKSASIYIGQSHTTKLQEQPEPHSGGSGGKHPRKEEQHQRTTKRYVLEEQRQPLGGFPAKSQDQGQEKHGHVQTTQSSLPAYMSHESGKVDLGRYNSLFQKDSSSFTLPDTHNMPKQDMKRNLEDLLVRTGGTPQRAQGDEVEEEESGTMSPERGNTTDDMCRDPEYKRHIKTLQLHLSRKLGQAIEGMIPVCVRRSWLAANHAIPLSSTHTRPVITAPSKGQEVGVNTSQELPFLDPKTRLLLEAHIKTHRLRHRMHPPSCDIEFGTAHTGEAPALPRPCPAFSYCDSKGDFTAKDSRTSEEVPRKIPAQQVIKQLPLPTSQGPLHAVHSEGQRPCSGTPSGHTRESSETPTAPNGGPPSAHCSDVSQNQNQKGRIIVGRGRGTLKPSPGPAIDRKIPRDDYSEVSLGDTCQRKTMGTKVGSQIAVAKGTSGISRKEVSASLEVFVKASTMANSQTLNANHRGSGSLGTSKCPPSSRDSISHEPGEQNLNAQVFKDVDFKVNIGAPNHLQYPAPGFLQDGHTVGPPRPDIVRPPQVSLASSHSMPKSNTCTLWGPGNRMTLGKSSQEQQVPSMLTPQDSRKSDGGISAPPDKTADRRSFRPGWQKEKLAGLRPSQASEMSPPAQTEDTYDTENLLTRNLPDQGQAPPEGHREKRMMYFLQCLNPNTKNKKQEDVIQNVKDPSATAHDPVSNAAVQISNTGPAEAEMLKRVVGQVLVDTMERRHGSAPSELHWSKREPHQSEGRRSSYQGSGCDPGQKTKVQRTASGQEASHKGHCHSSKSSGMRDRQVRPFYPGSQCHRLVTTSTGHGAQLA